MRVVLEGEPTPKGRPRFNRTTGTTYTPRETRAYEDAIAMLLMIQKEKFLFEPVKFTALFFTNKKNPGDVDNFLKATLDAANKQAFTDDKQVVEVHAERIRSTKPRTEITIEVTNERKED